MFTYTPCFLFAVGGKIKYSACRTRTLQKSLTRRLVADGSYRFISNKRCLGIRTGADKCCPVRSTRSTWHLLFPPRDVSFQNVFAASAFSLLSLDVFTSTAFKFYIIRIDYCDLIGVNIWIVLMNM